MTSFSINGRRRNPLMALAQIWIAVQTGEISCLIAELTWPEPLTRTHTDTHTYTHLHIHTYTHTTTHTPTVLHTHLHTHTYTYTHAPKRPNTHARVRTHTRAQTHIHTHIQLYTVSQKNCAKLFLSELCKIFINCNNFLYGRWQNGWNYMLYIHFHLASLMLSHYLVKHKSTKFYSF